MATFTKEIIENETKYIMKVFVDMNKSDKEYFSITFEQRCRGRLEVAGAGHDTIRKYYGTLFDDVIPMHLSNSDGVPMYALENGFYYLQNPNSYKPEVVANHFRIPLDSVDALKALSKDELAKWVEDQKPRWKAESEIIRAKYMI